MKKYLILFLLVSTGVSIYAQRDIKIMSYNLLIYPQGDMVNRIDTLSEILDYYKPDLLLLQELKSEEGFLGIEDELNELFGNYKAGTYVDQISNPSNSWRLQQNLIYNANEMELVEEEVVVTPYRDVNYFQLRILEDDATPSSELIHVYVTHLKSSQGNSNEQLRLVMAEVLFDHIRGLPPESNVIVAGDFNVYHGGEPAYEELLGFNQTNTLYDPIDEPGWGSSNFSNKKVYTQSTRLSSLEDGSGGGMDDRFDFVLLSENLMSSDANLSYQEDSYLALGNNGTCYNQDLIDCTTDDNVPLEILEALYYMSDHLPVVLSLEVNELISSTEEIDQSSNKLVEIQPNPASEYIDLSLLKGNPCTLRVYNMQGMLMMEEWVVESRSKIDINHLASGLYYVHVANRDDSKFEVLKMLVNR